MVYRLQPRSKSPGNEVLPTRMASVRFSHILMHLGPLGFVCVSTWWEYITTDIRHKAYRHPIFNFLLNQSNSDNASRDSANQHLKPKKIS